MAVLTDIKSLVARGDLRSALEILGRFAKGTHFESEVVLLLSRYNNLRTRERIGVISSGETQVEFNRVAYSVIELLRSLESRYPNKISSEEIADLKKPGRTFNRPNFPPKTPIKLFLSYAHKDEHLKNELIEHLAPLRRSGLIETWHDREIQPGEKWEESVKEALEASQIVLFLLSPSFLHSSYVWDNEIRQTLMRYEAGKVIVIPVIARPCAWQSLGISQFQALPKDAKPVTTWENQDEAWLSVVEGLRQLITELKAS